MFKRILSLLLIFTLTITIFSLSLTVLTNADTNYLTYFPIIGGESASVTDSFGDPRTGHTHQGNDIFARKGAALVAVVSGTIGSSFGSSSISGYRLWLNGDNGHTYFYCHLNNDSSGSSDGPSYNTSGINGPYAPGIAPGVHVRAGQTIGYAGDSGNAEDTTAHLHFEIHPNGGSAVDPYPYLMSAPRYLGTVNTVELWKPRPLTKAGDFNGDGRDDIGIFRPADTARWYIAMSTYNGTFVENADFRFPWGTQGDQPLVGDFNGDHRDDIGIYRPGQSGSRWYVAVSTGGRFTSRSEFTRVWGMGSDQPLVGDFTGDGRDDIAVFRNGDTSRWYVAKSTTSGFIEIATFRKDWGSKGDTPLVGDFNRDGKDDIAIYRKGDAANSWYVAVSTGSEFRASSTLKCQFGRGIDRPLVGDFNGDTKDDIAIYRPTDPESLWYVRLSNGQEFLSASNFNSAFGRLHDKPFVGDFNGDHRIDAGTYRTGETSFWAAGLSTDNGFIHSSTYDKYWGTAGDFYLQ